MKIWQNINNNDWILFYFNSRYTYAGKIIKKQKSNKITKKIFGQELQDKNLIIYCNEIYEIKKGFQKTNLDMGFQAAIPKKHKINLIQAKEKSVYGIIEKFKNIVSPKSLDSIHVSIPESFMEMPPYAK